MPPAGYGSVVNKCNHAARHRNTDPQRNRCKAHCDTLAVGCPPKSNAIAATDQQGHANRTYDQGQFDPERIERGIFGGAADKQQPAADDRAA